MVVSILYFSKVATYQIFFDIDYDLYFWIQQVRLPLNTIVRLRNIAIAAFLFVSASYIWSWKHIKWYYFGIILFPLILLVIRHDPAIIWKLFLYKQSSNSSNNLIFGYIDIFFSYAVICIYLSIPLISLILNYKKTAVIIRKNRLKIYFLCISIINIFFFATFVVGMFSDIMYLNTNEASLPKGRDISTSFTQLTQIIYIFLLFSLSTILLLNRKFSAYVLINRYDIFVTRRTLEKNCNMIFHIYKNAFLGIKRQTALIQRSLENCDYKKAESHIDLCQNIAETHLEMINKTISFLSDVKLSMGPVKINECINQAIKVMPIPDNIKIRLDIPVNEPFINADEYHLIEALTNIITNSVNALCKKEHFNPMITIKESYESDYGIIEILDNGIGIERDKIKNIFTLFYSSKFNSYSSGIGLYYTKNVITQMKGEIRVESNFGEFTKFIIALPLYR